MLMRATVLFTDESRFVSLIHEGRIRVWRRPRERFHDISVIERDCYVVGSIMLWDGIGIHHVVGWDWVDL